MTLRNSCPASGAFTSPLGFGNSRSEKVACGETTLWFEGFVRGRSAQTLADEVAKLSLSDIAAWLDGLDGFFRMVVLGPAIRFAACDPVRSYPLVFGKDHDGHLIVSASGPTLEGALALGPHDLDLDAVLPLTLSGFTIGAQTIYAGISQIGPGQYLWLGEGGPLVRTYHLWDPWHPAEAADTESLAALHEKLIDDLIRDADGRQILVPLSAGLDSRFIASGLKEAGYDNVRTLAYGIPGNREAETSREIARRLGYEWHFLPYTNRALAKMFKSADYAAFKRHSDSLTGIHFPQEYHAISQLLEAGAIDGDTLVVNGQSGDFITGNHIQPGLLDPPSDPDLRQREIIQALIGKHFRQWGALRTADRLDRIAEKLAAEIAQADLQDVGVVGAHGVYEWMEFRDRQSKYVINGQRLYEHFGLAWRLPLWDRACLDWWARAPRPVKAGQRLYRETLAQTNWAGVWQDIPVNPTRIRPNWLRPIRFAAKMAHAPLGQKAWHRFEKRYFDYWMEATCAFAAWPYSQVVGDRREAYSAIAWHIEAYLKDKGAAWDGRLLGGEAR